MRRRSRPAIIEATLVRWQPSSGGPTERAKSLRSGHRSRRDQSAGANSDSRLGGVRDLSRSGCWVSRVSSACQRATSPNQKALSLALRASMARRRHSSARRRKCSTLTCFLPINRPTSVPPVELNNCIQSYEVHRVNSLRGCTPGRWSARCGAGGTTWPDFVV